MSKFNWYIESSLVNSRWFPGIFLLEITIGFLFLSNLKYNFVYKSIIFSDEINVGDAAIDSSSSLQLLIAFVRYTIDFSLKITIGLLNQTVKI